MTIKSEKKNKGKKDIAPIPSTVSNPIIENCVTILCTSLKTVTRYPKPINESMSADEREKNFHQDIIIATSTETLSINPLMETQ